MKKIAMHLRKTTAHAMILSFMMLMSWVAVAQRLPVLAYHDVDTTALKQTVIKPPEKKIDGVYYRHFYPQTISVPNLVNHFNWLKQHGYQPVSWQQVVDARAGKRALPEKPVLLTFDDGYESFYQNVYPLLKAYRFPAVFAVVTSWLEVPDQQMVPYDKNLSLPRKNFVSWAHLKEMSDSGWVEVASHTHALHKGVVANPRGSVIAAVLAPIYQNGHYENKAQYQARLENDFETSARLIAQHTGKRPRVMVWPYGRFNQVAQQAAAQAGMKDSYTLNDDVDNETGRAVLGRFLVEEESTLDMLGQYLKSELKSPTVQRVVHVDLDRVYDKNPTQLNRNVDALIERISQLGVTTVYLQAFADEDGNGVAEALYFPNQYLPVKADLFGQVAWQILTRAHADVYAWMPVLAFDLGHSYTYINDGRTGKPNPRHYQRLSPYSDANLKAIQSIYSDLSFYAKFNGLLFHDDAFMDDFESADSAAHPQQEPGDLAQARRKEQDLIKTTDQLVRAVKPYAMGGFEPHSFFTARNIYASVIMNPEAQAWFAQSLPEMAKHYDYVAVMAMPYMEHEQPISTKTAAAWLTQLAQTAKQQANPNKMVFELQATNWHTQKPIATAELLNWMAILKKNGIQNMGYYPDDFVNNHPNLQQLKPVFSLKDF